MKPGDKMSHFPVTIWLTIEKRVFILTFLKKVIVSQWGLDKMCTYHHENDMVNYILIIHIPSSLKCLMNELLGVPFMRSDHRLM